MMDEHGRARTSTDEPTPGEVRSLVRARLRSSLLVWGAVVGCGGQDAIIVSSKNFTESLLLGEIVAQQLERYDLPVARKLYLGTSFICHEAIRAGKIDIYVEYSGTAYSAILTLPTIRDAARVRQVVDSVYRARWDLAWTEPFGFDNTFAMLIRRRDAVRLGIRTLSEAVPHARTWRPAFGYEFTEREDGFQGLVKAYGFQFANRPATMDLGLSYRALADGRADFIAGSWTDGQIEALDLFPLEDDRHYFPPYEAAPVARNDVFTRFPTARAALAQLGGTITEEAMRAMNYQIDVAHRPAAEVAREFLATVPK